MAFIHSHPKLTLPGRLCEAPGLSTKDSPPVLSHNSRQIFISAARATTDMRILFLTQLLNVSWIFPGSHVVKEPKRMMISRDE